MRVLLVEDDPLLGPAAKLGLEQDGFSAVDWVTEGAAADRVLDAYRYDAIVLDLGLPDVDGEQLLRGWRTRAEDTPVIVLTARGFVLDRVRLLNLGADDYLVKPFDISELCARIRAVVRRSAGKSGEVLECGAVDRSFAVARQASRGPSACDGAVFPKLVAPGVNVRTADVSHGGLPSYAIVSGSSLAAPHAAGVLALLAGAFPSASVDELEAALLQSARDVGAAGPDNATGYGLVDALGAFDALRRTHHAGATDVAAAGLRPAIHRGQSR